MEEVSPGVGGGVTSRLKVVTVGVHVSQDQVSAEPVEWGPEDVSSEGETEPRSVSLMSMIVRHWCLEATRSTRGSRKESRECCWTVRLRYSPVGLKALLGGHSDGIGWASNHCPHL